MEDLRRDAIFLCASIKVNRRSQGERNNGNAIFEFALSVSGVARCLLQTEGAYPQRGVRNKVFPAKSEVQKNRKKTWCDGLHNASRSVMSTRLLYLAALRVR